MNTWPHLSDTVHNTTYCTCMYIISMMYTLDYVHICVCTLHVCMYMYVCTCMYAHVHTHVCTCMYVYAFQINIVNPRLRGRRVTVLSWFVCVCVSVCLSVTTKLLFKFNYLKI